MRQRYPERDGLHLSMADGVLEVCLTRPTKRNSLSDDMVAGLIEALEDVGEDEAVRVVLLSAAGEHFCAGFDIVSRNAGNGPRPRVGSIQRRLPSTAHRLIPMLMRVEVPVVCMAQGWIAGIGLHLVLAADFSVVAEDARLWEPFSARGLTADSGASWTLPRRIGEVRARDMLLLGRELDGRQAVEWGLVHRAVPATTLRDAAGEIVGFLLDLPRELLGRFKQLQYAAAQGHPGACGSDEC